MTTRERLHEIEERVAGHGLDGAVGELSTAYLIAAAPDLLAIARELDAENQRLKDIIMAGSRGMGFDEVEMALSEAEKDVDRLTDELQEAVRLLQMWVAYASKDSIPPGVDIDKSTTLIERYKEANNG